MQGDVEKEKIALVVPSLYGGGAERVAILLYKGLHKAGVKSFLITLEKGADYELPEYVERYTLSSLDGRAPKLVKILFLPYQFIKLRSLIKELDVSVSIGIMERANVLVGLLKLLPPRRNLICITTVHAILSRLISIKYGKIYKLLKLLYKALYHWVNRYTDCIITVSHRVRRDLINSFSLNSDKVSVIYNPVEVEKIRKMASEKLEPELESVFKNNEVIINVGRLIPQKGQKHLIKSFKYVKEKKGQVKLVIIGEGALRKELEALIGALGLKDDVILLGFQKNPFKFVHRSKVFVSSSIFEAFGLVIVEAMACGIPVISTDTAAVEILGLNEREVIREITFAKYGVIIPCFKSRNSNGDTSELTREEKLLARAILKLLEDQGTYRKYKVLSQQRAEFFSVEKITANYIDLISRLRQKYK